VLQKFTQVEMNLKTLRLLGLIAKSTTFFLAHSISAALLYLTSPYDHLTITDTMARHRIFSYVL
jgi:hypothetical protein